MRFGEKLRKLMRDFGLRQADVCMLADIPKSTMSQYVSGLHEPSQKRKREIARALGVQEDYFEEVLPEPEMTGVFNLPIKDAARLMGKSPDWVRQGLRDRVFPFGYAVKNKQWSYYISSVKFTEYTGIPTH